ncbi:MAG TPA: tripartite tricarboxylate transporter TctB family protein [Syntrophorhabdales bacterium]|nr:tripartite tricarboxylate transporter TctB family protein [Syntrophorhabdales bacterium]
MRNYNLFSGIFLLALSLGACVKAYRLGLGSGGSPGPGFIPFAIAALLGLMSLYLCLRGVIQIVKGYTEKKAFKEIGWGKALLVLILLAGYGVFFNFLGFPFATFVFMMSLLWMVGRQRLRLSLAVSLVTAACAYILFVVLFDLPLPRGSLWQLFGE